MGYAVANPGAGGHGGGGAFGLVTNLVKDIGDAARGTPEGIVQTVEHPIRTAENVGKSTWQTWSPLFHGDVSKFGHQFYDHPLAPMLDIATVFTGGASVAAKLGIKASDAGLISDSSALARLGKMPTKVDITGQQAGRDVTSLTRTKYLPKNPIYNKVYRSAMTAADRNSGLPGWFLKPMSSAHVYGRLEKVDWAHSGLALRAQIAAMMKAGEVFNKAGHSDWKNLEDQLYSRNYGSLVQHSETIPVSHIPAPEPSSALQSAIKQRDRFAERLQTAHANEQQFLVDRRARIAANSKVGGKGFLLDNPHRETIVTLGHQLDEANKKVARIQKAHETSYAGLHEHFGGAEAPGIPHGYTYVAKVDPTKLFDDHAKNVDDFAKHVGSLADHFTTTDIRKALITTDEHGNPVVHLAHRRELEAGMLDAKNGTHFLAKLARYPTTIWKAVTLGLSPRVIVNNGIGNWFMYAMRQGGSHSAQGFIDAVRFTKGERSAMKMLKDTGSLPKEHFLNQHFRDELGNTFGTASLGSQAGVAENVGGKLGGAGGGNALDKVIGGIYKHGFYKGVHQYSDVPVRAAAISAFLRGDPLVKGLMKSGKSFEDAASTALKSNKELRDRAALHARSVAGDYTTMSGFEQAVRDFVPFYLWDKHIAKHAVNMLRDRTGVVAAGSAVGQEGANATRKQLGNVPDWMIGGIPLNLHIPGEGGRKTLLNTQGMNPYSTVPDLVGFAQALTTGHTEDSAGDTILGTVNPTIKGLIEHTMGQKATGAPITSHGGVIPSTLVDIFNSLRPVALARTAAGATPAQTKNPRLYKTDINTILSSIAGVPIQEADLSRAAQLAAQIANGGKKPKKGRSAYALGH